MVDSALRPRPRQARWSGGAMMACVALVGCSRGPQVGAVTGTVAYGGQPLPGIKVTFDPVAGGRSSTGITGADGGYVLQYTRDRNGALVGMHEVRVNWPAQTAADLAKRDKYPIPPTYNTATTLTCDVKPGSNRFDVLINPR
jgi:hypothetical protein